ncbi:signal peptidase II [Paenibacillus swuensis]|uniref:Lipoprotein signal peptidase n=1 Tax=Paenibacillus swuensis TaxID=1178515 RepID=A0A172TK00_9BACL|nr:signal peptidase II [Paenibacillus swuensis]ANE47389.1 signal peptidase II [Paenibacillus swuensis]
MYKFYGISILILALDQFTKWLIKSNLELQEQVQVLGEFFVITSHRNRGAAFGILQDQRWFFILITIVILAGLIWYLNRLLKEGKKLLPTALSLILGGALGNFIDRALYGEVVDFFQFTFDFSLAGKSVYYVYPIFNVADMAIVIGVGLIIVDSLMAWRNEKRGMVNDASNR